MRAFANAFLVAFFADGLLSLVNALLARGVGVAVLPGPARLLALATGVLALGVFVLAGLGPRLPKRLFLPLCLFLAWSVMSGLPLPVYLGLADTAAVLGAAQVLLGAAALGWVRRRTGGRSWLLTADAVAGPGFRWGHAAGYFGAAAVLGPPAAAGYAALCLALAASHLTGGFVALGPRGLSAQERVYARGDQRVHLAAMVHVAEAEFYCEVLAGVPSEGSVVLLEGVSDEGRRLRSDFSYGRLASALGLDAQEDALTLPEALAAEPADVDVAEFAPSTIELLGAAGRVLGSADAAEAVEAYRGLAEAAARPGAAEQIRSDLIELRDRRLLERLGDALERHRRVVVPWGAAHMPGIEAGVLALGFRLEESRQRPVIRFGRGSTREP